MEVFVANEAGEQELAVDEAHLSALARHVLVSESIDGGAELSVILVSPDHMRRLNHRFASDDYATDVLAFPMMEEDDEGLLLGDVVICTRVAHQNALRHKHSLKQELELLLVHGTLHLLGYDHEGEDDKSQMERRIQELLVTFASTPV